jgi:hypothetical protein
MTLPASGAISFSNINTELCRSSTAQLSLNDSCLRTLFGQASGAVCMNTGHGKTNTSVPGIPTGVSASATSSSAISVSFSAPGCTGHLAIDYYQAVCTSSGTNSATGASSPISITGLSAATSYTFKVRAHNSKGYGCYSSSTGTATTQAVTGQAVYTTSGCYTFTPPAGVSRVSSLVISPSSFSYGPCFSPCVYWLNCGGPSRAGDAGIAIYSNNKSVTYFRVNCTVQTPSNSSFNIRIGNSNSEITGISKQFPGEGSKRNLLYAYPGGSNSACGVHWFSQFNFCSPKCAAASFGGYGSYNYNDGPYQSNHKSAGGGGATGFVSSYNTYTSCGVTRYTFCNTTGSSRGGRFATSGISGTSGNAGGGGGGSYSGGGGGGGTGLYGGSNAGSGGGVGSGGGGGSGGCSGSNASGINGGRGGAYGGGAGAGLNCYTCGSHYSFGVGGNPPNNSNPHYGAIRIVWPGCVRKFPNTCVGNY